MFGKIKDLNEMRKQAAQIQSQLANETVAAENHGVRITMNGKMEILSVAINPELPQEEQEKYLAETFNDAIKKVQSLMAQKMMGRI